MNTREFDTLLQAPFWSKELVVWNAPLEPLDHALAVMTRRDLDLLDLLPDDERLPSARDERGDLIRRQLEQFLQSMRPENSDRMVLVVQNPALLASYSVGLQPFYDWFGGAKSMTVLALGRVNSIELPNTPPGKSFSIQSGSLATFAPRSTNLSTSVGRSTDAKHIKGPRTAFPTEGE